MVSICSVKSFQRRIILLGIKQYRKFSLVLDKANDLPIIAADKRELVVKEFFDLNCDICGTKTSSLKNAQEHYLNQHNNFNGYMKCCNKQLKTERAVEEHIRLHINPFVFQ